MICFCDDLPIECVLPQLLVELFELVQQHGWYAVVVGVCIDVK